MIVADSKAPGGERTKLLDFGIAKLADDGPSGQFGHVKTSTNSLLGTPYYMSPEQCRGAGAVDGRSDVYSLGIMMYEMLSGVRPITGDGQGDIIVKHITEEPTPLRRRMPELPESITALVHRMMTKDREKRPAMSAMALELEALSGQFPPTSARRSTANLALVPATVASPDGQAMGTATAAGQATPPKTRRSNLFFFLPIAIAGLAFGAIGARQLRLRSAAQTAALSAPQSIRWTIDSSPPGAEVIQVSDGRVLGTTPWTNDRPAGPGTVKVKLRLSGYGDKELELSQNAGAARKETLTALPPPLSEIEPPPEIVGKKG